MNRRFGILKKARGRRHIVRARNMRVNVRRGFASEIRYNRHAQLLQEVFFLKNMLPALCW